MCREEVYRTTSQTLAFLNSRNSFWNQIEKRK
jgi:hypothetical protein